MVTGVEGNDPLHAVVAVWMPVSRRWWCWNGSPPNSGWPSSCTTGFGVPFDEIAEVLGVSPAAARQHASRPGAPPRPPAPRARRHP